MSNSEKDTALGAANTESGLHEKTLTDSNSHNDCYDTPRCGGQGTSCKARLLMGAALHVLETLTEDEARGVYDELYNATEPVTLDGFNFRGEELRDLLGGEVVCLATCGEGEGLSVVVRTADGSVVEVEGWANIYIDKVADARFDVTRADVIRHNALTKTGIDAFASELLRIIRARARAELEKRRRLEAGNEV